MSSLCVPNFDSVPSSMPKLQPINHFPQVNPLVPGVKLLEYFKTLMKFYYRSVFAESFKTFIFQKCRRLLYHKVNLPSCVARRRRFIMTCDVFGTGQTNILGLCYLFGKTYKQPTVAPLKSLKSTHSTKLLHLLRRTIRYHQPSRLFHNDTQFKQRFRCKQSLRLKYAMIKLKPGFHMIATIAVIAAIAEKKKISDRSDHCDHMKPLSSDCSDNNR